MLRTLGYWIEENAALIVFNSQLLIPSELLLLLVSCWPRPAWSFNRYTPKKQS